jgi:hypothetical protein
VIALEQSLFEGTDRATYSAEADVSPPAASNDRRRLLDAGLITQRGRGPTTRYVASEVWPTPYADGSRRPADA